jgi:hypothetical protein
MNIQKLIQLDKQKKGKDALDAQTNKEVIFISTSSVFFFYFLHFFSYSLWRLG